MAAPVPGTQAWYQSRATPLPKTNVPKPKTANVPFAGNPMDFVNAQGTPAATSIMGSVGSAGSGASYVQPSVMTKAAVAPTEAHWNTPQITADMISSDWEPMQVEAAGSQQMSDAEGGFQKALRQAFIDYGGDVSKVGDWSKYIDQTTMDAARTNKYSAAAEALQAYTKSLALSRSKLAARGMLSSGATDLQTNAILSAREKAEAMGLRTFQGGADAGLQDLGTLRQQIADKLAAARASAAARLAAANPATWIEGTPGSEAEYAPGSPENVVNEPAWEPPPGYDSPAMTLPQEQAYYQSRATPIPAAKPPPKKSPGNITSKQEQNMYQAQAITLPKKKK